MIMKGISVFTATVVSAPYVGRAAATLAATGEAWDIGKDVTFAGLVWFFVGYLLPKMQREHREEREEMSAQFREEMRIERQHRETQQVKFYETLRTVGDNCHAVQSEANKVMGATKSTLDRIADNMEQAK